MERRTIERIRTLAASDVFPSVTMYMTRSDRFGAPNGDRLRLAKLVGEAELRLVEAGVRAPVARSLLAKARGLRHDREVFGPGSHEGLAVFTEEGGTFCLPLEFPCAESVDVGPGPYVTPLLHRLVDDRFLVLAVSEKSVSLYRGDLDGLEPVELPPGVPRSLEEAIAGTALERTVQHHTAEPRGVNGGRNGVVHGHGEPHDQAKTMLEGFFRSLARGLRDVLRDGGRPIVLVSVAYYQPMIRSAFSGLDLLVEGVHGSPDGFTEQEMHARARAVVEPLLDRGTRRAIEGFRNRLGSDRTTGDTEAIVVAARAGRVETLFVEFGARRWGRLDGESAAVHEERRVGDVDLVNVSVRETLRKGGSVSVVDTASMPLSSPMAALLRW